MENKKIKNKQPIPPRGVTKLLETSKRVLLMLLCEEQLLSDGGASPHGKSHYLQFNALISSEPMQRSVFLGTASFGGNNQGGGLGK